MDDTLSALTADLLALEKIYETHRNSAFSTPDTDALQASIRARFLELGESVRGLPPDSPYRVVLKSLVTWAYDMITSYRAARETAKRKAIQHFHPTANVVTVEALMVAPSIFDGETLLGSINQQRTDVLRLEQSIKNMNDLFVQMQALAAAQSVPLDTIERHVETAVSETRDALPEFRQATRLQKKSRKKKWMLLGLGALAVAGAVVGGPMGAVKK